MNERALKLRVFDAMTPGRTYEVIDLARATRLGTGATSEALVALWQAGQVRTGAVPGTYVRPA